MKAIHREEFYLIGHGPNTYSGVACKRGSGTYYWTRSLIWRFVTCKRCLAKKGKKEKK